MVKHIIFDFGGVYLNLNGKHTGMPSNLAKVFHISEEEAIKLWQEQKEDLLTGKETTKQFLTRISDKFEIIIDIDKSQETWKQLNKIEKEKINWELVNFTQRLKKSYKVHLFTDTIDLDNGAGDWINSILQNFDNIFKSFEIGQKKPDPKAYYYVLNKIKAKPEETVFIDDFPANIDAAKKLGMNGILFTNVEELKRNLANHIRIYE